MNILAIDLGKFNSMCCFYDTKTQEYRFQTIATTRPYLTAVFTHHKIDLVVMEACGPSGWISDLCQECGLKTLVCSTNEAAWLWKNVKRKTDKDDALKLARLAMLQQLISVHVPIVTNLNQHSKNVVKFYNGRGTAEQWIKEGKNAVKWTKLSCRTFKDNQARLQLFALAYNLGNFLRRLALPKPVRHWSLTTLREKLIKIGAKVTRHSKYVFFQLAEVAVTRNLFAAILDRIERLALPPPPIAGHGA